MSCVKKLLLIAMKNLMVESLMSLTTFFSIGVICKLHDNGQMQILLIDALPASWENSIWVLCEKIWRVNPGIKVTCVNS